MVIAPEFLPNSQGNDPLAGPGPQDAGPFSGLKYGVPENYGSPPDIRSLPLPGDVWPEDEDDYKHLLSWCLDSFKAAEAHREPFEQRWRRYYRLYRSHIEKRPGDWHSTVFIPMVFWVIETVTPRLVAQLPKFTALPVTEDDIANAQNMETALQWAAENSGMFEQLVACFKSALKYGTGILKTYHRTDIRRARKRQPQFQPLIQQQQIPVVDENGQPYVDFDGNPIVETRDVEMGQMPMGMQPQVYQYTAYDGPATECVDIFNFWVAPLSYDIQSARYVIHRTWKPMSYIKRRVKEGIYRMPSDMTESDLVDVEDDPALKRLQSIGLGGGTPHDPGSRMVELLEFWLDDGRKIVLANRKALLQVIENPFDHSEKPFIRIVDYYQEHEFWGVGEIEPIEGLQDEMNAIHNSRLDNIRLLINSMFGVNINHVEDMNDFTMRPGGRIRIKGDMKVDEVFQRIDLGDVTSSAFAETEIVERTTEKVTGVSAMQMGLDSPTQNSTATGLAITQELGASRFGMKSKLIELMGLGALGRHYASLLQQFMSEERQIRLGLVDPETQQPMFTTLTPDSIHGAFDIGIQSESLQQSQTMKIEQRQNLLALVAQFAPQGVNKALMDVLEAMGVKDKEAYVYGDPNDPMSQMQMQAQMAQLQMASDPMAAMGGDPSMGGGQPPMAPSMMGQPPTDPSMDPSMMDPAMGAGIAEGTGGDANADAMMAMMAQQFAQQAQV